ncbi:MAG: SMI1/KNR4 family protein [Sandaracinaceae bacterium]|nr:SMI1/KNR4 family protein [Sandaracinaceae bacterium]
MRGGRPRRSFYFSREHNIEVGVGYVLLVDRGASKMTDVAYAVAVIEKDSARKGTVADDLVPFAVDNGNAHYLCVDREGRVVYRILHDPPETERRVVADSLADFLAGLEEEP